MTSALPVRPPLDRARIVQAVLEIGVDQFSMHAVARHLDVSATALYRYFPSREALLAGVMDTFCGRLELPDPGTEWAEYMRLLAHSFRRALLEMPGAADYGTAIGPATPAAFAIVDGAIRVLRRDGYSPEGAWRAYSLVVSHAFQSVQGQERFRSLVERSGPGGFRIYQLTDEEKRTFPDLAAVVESIAFDFEASFELTLACVISGLQVELERGKL